MRATPLAFHSAPGYLWISRLLLSGRVKRTSGMSDYPLTPDLELADLDSKAGVNVISDKSDGAGVVVRGVDSPEGTVHREYTFLPRL